MVELHAQPLAVAGGAGLGHRFLRHLARTRLLLHVVDMAPLDPDADPVRDAKAIAAQRAVGLMQGQRNTWYAGAWLGHGFHEDGIRSAHAVADAIGDAVAAPAPIVDARELVAA